MSPDRGSNDTDDDEIVTVNLPRRDVRQLREIIERDRSVGVVGKYIRTVLLVSAGGLITLFALWDALKSHLFGGSHP